MVHKIDERYNQKLCQKHFSNSSVIYLSGERQRESVSPNKKTIYYMNMFLRQGLGTTEFTKLILKTVYIFLII